MAENWKQQRCFLVDEWMNKLLYLGNEILFGTKKKVCYQIIQRHRVTLSAYY